MPVRRVLATITVAAALIVSILTPAHAGWASPAPEGDGDMTVVVEIAPAPTSPAPGGGKLPRTGTPVLMIAAAGLILLGTGTVLVRGWSRRGGSGVP